MDRYQLLIVTIQQQKQVTAEMLERRRTPRHQLGHVAAIFCGRGAERSCLVKDFSDGGVRLQSNAFEVPDEFVLLFGPNELAQSGRYKVVWRLGNEVGAKLLSHQSAEDSTG